MARTGRETLELTIRVGVRIGQQEVHFPLNVNCFEIIYYLQ